MGFARAKDGFFIGWVCLSETMLVPNDPQTLCALWNTGSALDEFLQEDVCVFVHDMLTTFMG